MKPTIGVTRCSRLDDYVSSVEQAGGRARVLETSESPRRLLGEIDGLLLTGGGDIDPVLYGDERHPTVEDAEPGRDEFEIDLARRAMAGDLPLLAICRGVQVMNVAAGGTLIQDIPSLVDTALPHSIVEPKSAEAHDVGDHAGIEARRGPRPKGRQRAYLQGQQSAPSVDRPRWIGSRAFCYRARRRCRSCREG